jgi:hypothetical protein
VYWLEEDHSVESYLDFLEREDGIKKEEILKFSQESAWIQNLVKVIRKLSILQTAHLL